MSTVHPAVTSDLLLKVTPPRVPRDALVREAVAGATVPPAHAVVLVQAAAGFGKTLLLAQWRRDHLAQGAAVAWLLAQPQDEPARLVQALALAVRVGAGRPTFGHALLQGDGAMGLEGVTGWLAEVAQSALQLVLIVDEADRLSAASREALAYLLRNAPPNLRCIVAARTDCHLGLDDLVAYGDCLQVGTAQLRFSLDEAIHLARNRFGEAIDRDAVARLHELADGWPLGVQLALSVSASTGARELPRLALQGAALRTQLLDFLLGNLAPADLDFLTRISVAEPLHPALCAALLPGSDAAQRLQRLVRDTPVFVAAEHSEWLRLHALACEALRERLAALPEDEQQALHARAADWMAEHGLLDAAAGHALAAGQQQKAYALAERSLYEMLMTRGRQGAVLEWLDRLPAQELDRRPRLLLAAAWSLALSERHDEAQRLVTRILAQPSVDDSLRCECALILGGAAVFADDPDRFAELHDPWAAAPPLHDPLLLQVHANRTAFRALLDGEPALARLRQQQAPLAPGDRPAYLSRWGDFIIGLTYLWEGQVLLAEQLLRPSLAAAEADLGRRSSFASMFASLLAAAVWERDQPEEAAALLANRLDVLERSSLPESALLGYRTMARIAIAADSESRALDLLGAMDAVGIARKLPRLRVASLADQVRLHARRFRTETCRDLCRQMDELLAQPDMPTGQLWQRSVQPLRLLARGYAAIAAQDWRAAVQCLAEVEAVALKTRQGRVRIEALALRAWALDRCGEKAQPLLQETLGLARASGLQRVFADAHPGLAKWLSDSAAAVAARPVAATSETAPVAPATRAQPRALPSMALTPKEREVLELLARSLSNKEIGLAMQVGEETIKWHMKNLFAKLDAGTRKQVVSRARILGLLADAPTV
ncbi:MULTISPECIES: LuxR C-terminal-related transcriptional regulator [Ramlibacter]|uniref:LuxR C-terminal-related transcriptional regulator n=1 Tax=Ramlibacter TaxID=174951 RepID=UPI0030843AD2